MPEQVDRSFSAKQRVFVVLLLIAGTLLALGAIRFMSPADTSSTSSPAAAHASISTARRSERP